MKHKKSVLGIITAAGIVLGGYQALPMKDCSWCHRATRLNRHHLVSQTAHPELRDVATNLVIFCRDCHFVIGHRCNWKTSNPDALEIVAKYTNTVKIIRPL